MLELTSSDTDAHMVAEECRLLVTKLGMLETMTQSSSLLETLKRDKLIISNNT